jgi:hypothetical protein
MHVANQKILVSASLSFFVGLPHPTLRGDIMLVPSDREQHISTLIALHNHFLVRLEAFKANKCAKTLFCFKFNIDTTNRPRTPHVLLIKPTEVGIYLSMALQPMWTLAVFAVSESYTQSLGLRGRGISPSQGRYLHTE